MHYQFLKNSVSTVLAHSPFLYDEDLAPFQRRACATADSFTQLEQVRTICYNLVVMVDHPHLVVRCLLV